MIQTSPTIRSSARAFAMRCRIRLAIMVARSVPLLVRMAAGKSWPLRSSLALTALAAIPLLAAPGLAQEPESPPAQVAVGDTIGSVQRLDPALDDLIPADATIQVLGTGYDWSEGPVWIEKENRLLFSDIPPNKVMQWQADAGVSLYQERVGFGGPKSEGGNEPGTNGLFLAPDGQLYACCHGDRCIKRRKADETWEVVVDKFDGKRFNSPNDLVFDAQGNLYFTDPPYGLAGGPNDPARELDFCGVYRWDGQTVQLLTKEFNRPNGIGFSPDFQTLYVAQSDSAAPIYKAFAVKADGTLGEGKVLADASEFYGKLPGSPDGLAVDQQGNLWATGPGGVWVISPKGKVLGKILTGQATANCTFGGPDGSWLFMTADMYLCRIQTKTKAAK